MPADLDDRVDFDDADRGFIASIDPMVVKATDGRVIFEMDSWTFLSGECPETAHPNLWRQGRLNARHGLFQVCEGIYQVRGFDISNMTLVEGERGVIVIDPLMSAETAAAALALYREHRGGRPVTAVIYTHSHADHFGGCSASSRPTPTFRSWHRSTSWSTRCRRTSMRGRRCGVARATTERRMWRRGRAEPWGWGLAREARPEGWA